MRHRKAGLKLSRKTGHLSSMFRNLVTSLFKHDRIRTTDTKAKELRRWADHLVGLAKRGDLHARRQALAIVQEREVVQQLFEKAAERFGATAGGYTRLVKIGPRAGDAAPMTLIELIGSAEEKKQKKKGRKKTEKAPAAAKKSAAKKTSKAKPTGDAALSASGEAEKKAAATAEPAPEAAPAAEAKEKTE